MPAPALRWKPAFQVFEGGTKEALALRGFRVRLLQRTGFSSYEANGLSPKLITLDMGASGFVANPKPGMSTALLIAFPKAFGKMVASLDALTKAGNFVVVAVDWTEFRNKFEVEIA